MTDLMLKPSFYAAATFYAGTAANMVLGGPVLLTVAGLAATIATTAAVVYDR